MTVKTILETGNIRILCYNPGRENLIVEFDFHNPNRDGFPAPQSSASYENSNCTLLKINSAHNDWFLSADLPLVRDHLSRFTKPYRRIVGSGFSMGGYGALLLSRPLRLNQVFLVSPQFSIFPQTAPYETKYLKEAAMLDPTLDTLAHNPRKGLRGVLLFDPSKHDDACHAKDILKLFPNITPVPLAFGGHPATRAISEAGFYKNIQQEILRNRIRPEILLALHKKSRETSPSYQNNLSTYLQGRMARGVQE